MAEVREGAGVFDRLTGQVLNAVGAAPATDRAVRDLLAADAAAPAVTAVVESLLATGRLVRPTPDTPALTDAGRTCRAEAAVRVDAFRALAARGVSTDEYTAAVGVLARMTRNLTPAA
ncbi:MULTISPECIES: MarR family transcriptional regulator [unclassified Streptomyces]|uniref:MarR family transcriptional regulator n=1 Tax=unclassified Streptomyces TaxID=2593676 RepID=UPI00109E6A7C|nr:MarR family transcriptional regulator [Streptomyces sp. A1136]THA46911.1 MarR family transcriptional regulator [Streptomyces sp. A1136]